MSAVNRYQIEFCWNEHYGGPKPHEFAIIEAYTAQDAVFQFQLDKGDNWRVIRVMPEPVEQVEK